jgi:hypothetical protein
MVGKPEGKIPLGIPGRRWMNKIRMDLLGEVFYIVLFGKPEGKHHWGDLDVDG